MRVLDRINLHVPLARAGGADIILLGRREAALFRAQLAEIYKLMLDYDSTRNGSIQYRGLTIYVLEAPTAFILAKHVHTDTDENVHFQLKC